MNTSSSRIDGAVVVDLSDERPTKMRFSSGTLHENWYIAARSDEVRRRPVSRTIMDEPLVLWRDSSGRLVAQLDRCLHRNAKLSEGTVSGNCIQCPYHGWMFDSNGACAGVPSQGPGQCRMARRLETFPVVEQDQFVWVYMGSPERAHERRPFAFPAVDSGWSAYVMTTAFDGDVTDLVENFMDVPHTAFVHKGWFRRGVQHKRVEATVERTEHSVEVTYHRPDDVIAFATRVINPNGLPMTHTDRFFMPNCTRVDYGWGARRHFIITSQITPVTHETAVVYTAITFTFGRLTRIASALLPPYTRTVIAQDVRIMANQTHNLRRFGNRQFGGTNADLIHRLIETLRDHARSGGGSPAPGPQSRSIEFWI